jgi:hypothetical protein
MASARLSKTDDTELKVIEFVIRDRLKDSPDPIYPRDPKVDSKNGTGGDGSAGVLTEYIVGVASEELLPKELDKSAT